jgi:sugar phosphate isomerase/epimerase
MVTMHLKDFSLAKQVEGVKLFDLLGQGGVAEAQAKREENGFAFQPVGYGKVDFPSIFKAIDETGVCWAGVEQDASPDRPPVEAAKISIDYIRSHYKL